MNVYKYSNFDRLKVPNSYMYTEYIGNQFIEIYYQNRQSIINFYQSDEYRNTLNNKNLHIMNKLKFQINKFIDKFEIAYKDFNFTDEDKSLSEIQIPYKGEILNREANIDINEVLNYVIYDFNNSSSEFSRKLYLNKLLRKFEVRKKIYRFYDQNFRESYGRFDDLEIYLKLKIALIIYYTESLEIQYLNTILKISDTLCSQSFSLLKTLPYKLHLMAIQSELILIKQIQNA